MIISSATVKIMKNIYGTFTKTQFVGPMTNYTQRNKGYGLCPMPLSYKGETCDKTKHKFTEDKANEKEIILCDPFYSYADTYAVLRVA